MKKFKLLTVFLVLLMVISLPSAVSAVGEIDIHKKTSIEILAAADDAALNGAEFEIYLVASIGADGTKTAAHGFEYYEYYVENNNMADIRKMAGTIESHAVQNGVEPFDKGKTDSNGLLTFPVNALEMLPGLYLVTNNNHIQGDYIYSAEPFVVIVPGMDDDGQWNYDVVSYPKFSKTPADGLYVDVSVIKIWKDTNHEKHRPAEVTVNLYKDKNIYDTVKLDASNSWRYTWKHLDKKADWSVAEEFSDGYTATVEKDGTQYVITNTYKKDTPPDEPEIPKTGQTWWPVPVLFACGLLFVVIGLYRRKTGEYEE